MWFLVRRVGFYLITAWVAITMNFLLPRMMPGGPVEAVFARHEGQLDPAAADALATAFGLDPNQSLWSGYIQYLGNLFTGQLGLSFTYFPENVSTVIAQSLPWTVLLLGVVTVVEWVLGTFAGVVAGWRRGGWLDSLMPLGAFMKGVPPFWIGLIAISVFAVGLGWFPVSGGYSSDVAPALNGPFILSALQHAALPALVLILASFTGHMLIMRNMMVTTLSEEYVRVAEAKGLRPRRIMFTYAARNALLPSVDGFALQLATVVSGALLVEKVFSYPGI